MEHHRIRFKILFTLYRKYFSGQLGQPQLTAALIKEADVEFFDPNLLYGNIVYLKDSGLVKGLDVLGQPYPYTLTITNLGIDYIDKLLKRLMNYLKNDFKSIGP